MIRGLLIAAVWLAGGPALFAALVLFSMFGLGLEGDPVFSLSAFGALAGCVAGTALLARPHRVEPVSRWAVAARHAAFTRNGTSDDWTGEIAGRPCALRAGRETLALEVRGLRDDLRLRRPSGLSILSGPMDVSIGDESFDIQVHLEGAVVSWLAILDERTRSSVLSLLQSFPSLELVGGTLYLNSGSDEKPATETFRHLEVLVSALASREPDGDRLLRGFTRETRPGIRDRMLAQFLAGSVQVAPDLARTLLDEHRSSESDLVAALLLGPEGADALESVARSGAAPAFVRAAALSAFAERTTDERWRSVARVLITDTSAAVRLAIVQAPRAFGDEDDYLRALRDLDGDVRAAAARALAERGTLACIPELVRLREGTDPAGKAAADAIARIVARNPGSTGHLALASSSDPAGRVSESTGAGAVTLARTTAANKITSS